MTTQQLKIQDELLFGTIAVREGYVTPAMIDDCVKSQGDKGHAAPKLGLLLIQKGHMTDEQVAAILDIQRRQVRAIDADPKRGGLFGHLCIELGCMTNETLDEALAEQEQLAIKGQPAMLGQILMRRNALTTDQFLKILKLQRRGVMRCAGCDTFYHIEDQPEGAKFVCRRCGTIVKVQSGEQARASGPGTDTAVRMVTTGRQEVGGQFGRYVILEELGRGGMGIVYKVLHRDLNSIFALKTLKEADVATAETVGRFRREAQAAARLKHPNLVAIHDAGEEQGIQYLVMDYVEGRSLAYRMAQRPKTRELVAILEKVARAVEHAHEHDIIHRDLKPGNIMIDKEGEPHVMDFGLAKFMDHKTLLTRTGSFLGTPFYMAPEQIRGDADQVDRQSDVYAMGVVLFEIVSGRPPHMGANSMEIFSKILNDEAPDPLELNPKAHPDLRTVCLKAIEKDKALRYQTAAEFADDLKRYLDGEPILARDPNLVERIVRKAKQNRTATLTVALILLLAVTAASLVFLFVRDRNEFERLYNKGRDAFSTGDLAGARYQLEAARRLRPHDRDVLGMISIVEARLAEQERRRLEDEERARRLAQAGPKINEAAALIDNLAAAIPGEGLDGPAVLKACEQVEAVVAEALAIAPDAEAAWQLKARSQEMRGDVEGAVASLDKALERGEVPDALSLRARLRLRRLLSARAAVDRPSFSPDSPAEAESRARAAADFDRIAKSDRSSPVQKEFAAVAAGHLAWQAASARPALDAYLAKYAADIEALRLRGDAVDLRKAIKYRPLDSGSRIQLARLLEIEGQIAPALAALKEASLIPGAGPYAGCAHAALLVRHRPVDADAAYVETAGRWPDSPVAHLELGRFRASRGQFDASLAPLARAAEISPADPLVFFTRGEVLSGLLRRGDAMADAETVVRLLPDAGAGYELRGRIHFDLRQWDAALVDFEQAAVRDPSARERLAKLVDQAQKQRKQ